MRTTGRGAPDAGTPWDEIVPLLWMGGHHYRDPAGVLTPAVAGREFDLVISLYVREGHGPDGNVEHRRLEIPDGPLTTEQIERVCLAAELAAESVRQGRRVLVRCHSGYNRSGLVVAQALTLLGYGTDDAVFLIRYRRSKWALNNSLFVDYLNTGLDVALLLTDLGSAAG
ncbi:dual specificity protein phosphatase family protein [Actinomadura sp. WMMA1423]|uniref:protein-tyrosine phosphatase family protein n=1 Tax=Actinomadura sp. WMMA1423 TaxID=2591108 RepID=UPI0011462F8D|nr:dual specificity protein phosphatase family protein [Actinomadura sp. WMMA1423]